MPGSPENPLTMNLCPSAGNWWTRHAGVLLLAALLALVALNFARAMNYPFLDNWDDGIFILENRHLAWTAKNLRRYATRPFQDLYTPLPMYSLMADNALFGQKSPLPYHLHNLALHLLATTLLFWIARKMGLSCLWAFLAALAWAANPQKSESVVWITERKDVLCGTFAFAAFLVFLLLIDSITIWKQISYAVFCSILTVLAIFAKPAAAPLVGIYVVYALSLRKWRAAQLIPVICGAFAVLWSAHVTAKTNPGTFSWAPAVPLHNLFWYPLTAILPHFRTNPIYPNVSTFPEILPILLTGLVLTALFLWYALKCRRFPWQKVLCGFLLLGGTMLPVLGMWVYTNFDYCDRYNYLVSAVAVIGLALAIPDNRLTRAAAVAILTLMVFATQINLGVWHDSTTLWKTLIVRNERVNPKVFEVAANDALIRDDAADLEYVLGFLRLHRENLVSPRLSSQQIDNTLLLLQSHLCLLKEEHTEFLRLIAPLMRQEAAMAEVPPFMRSPNYPKIYRRNAKFAQLLQRLTNQPQ